MVKVGSLFDGIGGTLLASALCDAKVIWSSEIDPIAESITKRHFPDVIQLGDITKIKGDTIETVDIIVGGSPCQDLSTAGKREGLVGERSGLFLEQIRVVKEQIDGAARRTDGVLGPRYMVWENVSGTLTSRKGEDFRIVLEETCRISDPRVVIPKPDKWRKSGIILGNNYSISWRMLDAKYWGVPQARRRIYLVADFRGHTAPEILFEQESLPWHITKSQGAWQSITAQISKSLTRSNGINEQTSERNISTRSQATIYSISPYYSNGMLSNNPTSGYHETQTSRTLDENGGKPDCNQGGMAIVQEQKTECTSPPIHTYATQSYSEIKESHHGSTLKATGGTYGGGSENYVLQHAVRRYTPLECERIQGYPDHWTKYQANGKPVSDSQRYQKIGASFAMPNAYYVIAGCVKKMKEINSHESRKQK